MYTKSCPVVLKSFSTATDVKEEPRNKSGQGNGITCRSNPVAIEPYPQQSFNQVSEVTLSSPTEASPTRQSAKASATQAPGGLSSAVC